jgi:rhamnosyltransferase subunit B
MGSRSGSRHVVFVTFGTLGDLHPTIALARGMRERGHRATVVTSAFYRERVEAAGLGFRPSRPDIDENDRETVRRAMDLRHGTEFVLREVFLGRLRESYADLRAALEEEGADLLVGQELTFAVPILAEQLRLPWAVAVLQPIPFLSAYDPPVLPIGQGLARLLRPLGPGANRLFLAAIRRYSRSWGEPVHALRRELGLGPGPDPIHGSKRTADLVLALFSPVFAVPQPDWPPQTVTCGFPFYDGSLPGDGSGLEPEVAAFLDAGEPPLVFTLGSSAVFDPGAFYAESAEAACRLGMRAILLVGIYGEESVPKGLPADILAAGYAPFSALLPRAAAVIHQGGIGTLAQVLRAGRPGLVVPFSHDQPDNAARAARLGVARTLRRNRYDAERATRELGELMKETYRRRAEEVARAIRAEDGVATACDALERLAASRR